MTLSSAAPFSDPESHHPAALRGGRLQEPAALKELAELRRVLLDELAQLVRQPGYLQSEQPDQCCRRPRNQMRMTPLEAKAIARAFADNPALQAKLPEVLERLRRELIGLRDNDERQQFECPLLENGQCLVHETAKPIGCLAWHPAADEANATDPASVPPPGERSEASPHYTPRGWQAFEDRDALNDLVYGRDWRVRVIPLWLRRVLAEHLAKTSGQIESRLAPHSKPRAKGRKKSS